MNESAVLTALRPRPDALELPRLEWIAAAGLALAPVAALGFADGGFFARPWAWAALGLAGVALAVVVLRPEPAVSLRPLLLLGVLAVLGLWIAASLAWTRSVGLGVLELQRLLVYLTGVAAAALLVRARTARALIAGVFLGSGAVTTWGLVSYLVNRENAPDLFQGSFLHRPMGYANAMAIASVIAFVLGFGIATDASSRRVRVAAAVALVPLASALALTGSRAAWGALLAGTAVTLAMAPDRARTVATWRWIVLVPAAAVLLLSAFEPTSSGIVGARADRLGERLLAVVVALTAFAILPALIATRGRKGRSRVRLPRRAWAAVTVASIGGIFAVGIARFPGLAGDRPTYWRAAAAEFRERPLLGSGAGTYAQVWLERRSADGSVRDAHSLVVETLSELGLVGFLPVFLLLGLPLVWALRARAHPLVPATAGAFAAYAVHASVDWDWEMPAVTLAGLFCAVAIGCLADGDRRPARLGGALRGSAVALCGLAVAVATTGLVGATALEDAGRSLARGEPAAAERAARRAERWQPWSVEPLLARGQARLALGDRRVARGLFARAAAREPNDYRTWLALAAVSHGRSAEAAVLRARALNPGAVRGDLQIHQRSKEGG